MKEAYNKLILSNALNLIKFPIPKANPANEYYNQSYHIHHKAVKHFQKEKDLKIQLIMEEMNEIKKIHVSKSNRLLEMELDYVPKKIDKKTITPNYYIAQDIFEIQFMSVLKCLNKSEIIEKELILIELQNISHKSSWKSIKDKLTENNLLKSLIYLYSKNYFYRKFNLCFSNLEYDKLKYTTVAIFQQLKNRPELYLKPLSIIYRGVAHLEINQYQRKRELYWPAFISTSTSKSTAESFAGENGYIFHITLLKKDPHPHIRLSEGWSAFPNENEVLLMPYFAFIIIDIKGNTIEITQNEKKSLFSLNLENTPESINEIINRELNPAIAEVIIQSKNECQALDLDDYFMNGFMSDIIDVLTNEAGAQNIKNLQEDKFDESEIIFIKQCANTIKGRIDDQIIERFKELYERLQQGIINIIRHKIKSYNKFPDEAIEDFLMTIINKISANISEVNIDLKKKITNKLEQWYNSMKTLIKNKKFYAIENTIAKMTNIIANNMQDELAGCCKKIKNTYIEVLGEIETYIMIHIRQSFSN